MNKKTSINYTIIVIIYSLVYGISFYYLKMFSKQNSWLICIISNIIGYLLIKMFLEIKKEYNKNIFETNKLILGKFWGSIINVIFTLTFLFLSALISWYLLIFLKTNFFDKTPLFLILMIIFIPIFYAINKNDNVLIKSSVIYLFIIFIFTFLAIAFLIPQMDFNSLKPFLEINNNSMLKGLFCFTSITYLPTYVVLGLKNYDIKKEYKIFVKNLFLSLSIVLSTYLVLGNSIIEIVDFPEFFVLRKIGIFANGTRIDSLIIIGWIISIYISNLSFIKFITNYLSFEIKEYKNKCNYFVIALIMLITLKLFKNVAIGKIFILNYLPIILFIILFILNFIIFLKIKVKQNVSHNNYKNN